MCPAGLADPKRAVPVCVLAPTAGPARSAQGSAGVQRFPPLSDAPIPLMRLNAARQFAPGSTVSAFGTPAVAGAMKHAVEADRRDECSSNQKMSSSFAAGAFHGTPPPRRNGSQWWKRCLTAWKEKTWACRFPDCRLTALLYAPDLLPTEVHVRSRFSAGLLQPGYLPGSVLPADGSILARKTRPVIKPVV